MFNLIKISDAVDELSALRRDTKRLEWLRYMIAAKSVLRDMKIIHLNGFKKVVLTVDKSNNTVHLPEDFYLFRLVSVFQEACDRFGNKVQKPVPLTYNPYINTTPDLTPADSCSNVANQPCKCQLNSPVTQELSNFSVICEDIEIDDSPPITAVKQTILRACANGDIVKEVTEPVQKFKQTEASGCDYNIDMELASGLCSYLVNVSGLNEALYAGGIKYSYNVNGADVLTDNFFSLAEVDAYMESIGWVVLYPGYYRITNTADVYLDFMDAIQGIATVGNFTIEPTCDESNFPYTISSYYSDGTLVTIDLAITSQAEQDAFFDGIGFTKISDTEYQLSASLTEFAYINVLRDFNSPCTYTIDFDLSTAEYLEVYIDGVVFETDILTPTMDWIVNFLNNGTGGGGLTFGTGLTWTKISDIQMSVESSGHIMGLCVFYDAENEFDISPDCAAQQIDFVQSNCQNSSGIVADGYENKYFREVLCNVELKTCGCIVESQSNIDRIVSCCGDWLGCCQEGQLSNWRGWPQVPQRVTNTPEPYNVKGTYRLDKENYLIYLDSVGSSKVLLHYYTDGNCDGEFYMPDYCIEAAKAGVAYKAAQYDESVSDRRRDELDRNYSKALKDLKRFYLDPIIITELFEALKTKQFL